LVGSSTAIPVGKAAAATYVREAWPLRDNIDASIVGKTAKRTMAAAIAVQGGM
jgi:hypothetical protein